MKCVNRSSREFKTLAQRNNVSEGKLELIVHQYYLENEEETAFPSDVYIQAQLGNTKYREPSKAVREVWKTKYSKPQEFSTLKEVQQAVAEASKFFPPSVIVYYKNNNNTFTLSVRQPVASLKHSINDFFKEGTSLDDGHFKTPLKGNQRDLLFNLHDGIKRQLLFMDEAQVKEALKTQLQNSDIPSETVEKISSVIDKMTKKQILSEIELMDREQADFDIILQDLKETGEDIRFTQKKQEPASATEDEIQFSVSSTKHTFTFADGTVVETPFKLNDQQADALNAMDAFMHSDEAVMTLSGYAGTGKTSLMEILADKASRDGIPIKFTASTNKAAKVLKNRVIEKGFFAQTLHKLFAYLQAQDESREYDAKNTITTRGEHEAKYSAGDVIVIDEASMINDGLYNDIVEDARNNHLKIIFVGDKKQLAPVGQKTVSAVFKSSKGKVIELTKVERTGDNAILAEATRLRNDEALTGVSAFNSKGQGVAYMSKQKKKELEELIKYFAPNIKSNPDYFRILAWSNNVVGDYNNMVRRILGYSSYIPQVGEPMMGYTNWGYKKISSPMEDPYDLVNSESYRVIAVGKPQTLKKSFIRIVDGNTINVEIESIPITLENSMGEIKRFDYIDVKQNAKNRNAATILAQQKADLWNKYRTAPRGRADAPGTKGWYAARAGEIERFLFVNDDITKSNPRDPNKPITLQAKVIDFGYAMTVHKSQGSTFTHVLVDDVNISKASEFEDTAPSTSTTEVSSEDLKTANETIEPVGPKKKLNIPGLANLLSKKASQPETLISTPAPKAAAKVDQERADIVQQLKYVAVSRATDTVTIISDNVKKEDSPLNHINDQKPTSNSITEEVKAEVGEKAVEETIQTLESDNTELNTVEKKSIKEILGDTKPRILIASETTDPVWHAKKIKEMVEEELKKPAKERSFHMMYLITKHDGIPLKELMELKIPKFIHFSITSLGGTKYEPGVMKMDDLLDRIETFIRDGVLNPNLTTVRIDPIIPGVTTKKDIRHIIERASKMGIRQFKFSIMDSYGYTENGNRDRFIIQKMEELGYDWNTYYGKTSTGEVEFHPKQEYVESIFKYMNSLAEEFNIWFNTCGENSHGVKGLSRIKFDMGCVNVDSMNAAMGTNDIAHVRGKQRKDCSCYGLKSDALRYTDKCASSCVYCYASHNSDRYVQYYNEDGTLKDNKFTRTSEKAIDAQQTTDNQQTIALSETWQKAQAIQEPSGRRPVEYTSPGQPARTYYVEGEHIYNDKGKEVYNAPQMRTHKNKILFKLAYKEGRAVIVNHNGNRYIVDRYQNILSVNTGEVMMWGDENGDKRDILALAENAFKDKLNTTQTTPQQPQQTNTQQQAQQFDVSTISNKTAAFGVVIDANLKRNYQAWQQQNPEGIVAYRINYNQYHTPAEVEKGHIGNPFSENKFGPETVQNFYNWIVSGINPDPTKYPKATEEFRQAIIKKLLATPNNAPILYYKELEGNRPSHATVIGYLVNNKHLLQQAQQQTQKSQSNTSKKLSTKDFPLQVYADGNHYKGTDSIGYGSVFEYQGKEYGISGTEQSDEVRKLKELFPNVDFSNPTMEMLALATTLEHFANAGNGEDIVINQDYKGATNYAGLWEYSEGSAQRDPKAWKAREPYIAHLVERAVAAIKKIEQDGGSVKLNWVKGHQTGTSEHKKGNDAADRYAKSRDIFNNINDAYGVQDGQQLQQSIKQYSVDEIYRMLKAQYSPNSPKAKLTDLVFNVLKKTEVKYKEGDSELNGSRGRWNADTNTILYRSDQLQDPDTFLHESIHAVTTYYLEHSDKESLPSEIRAAIEEIEECHELLLNNYKKEIGNYYKEFMKLDGLYGLTNSQELIAELFRPEMLKYIRKFDEENKNKNIFQRLINAVATFLGIKKTYTSVEKTLKDALVTLLTNPSKELMERHSKERDTLQKNRKKFDDTKHIQIPHRRWIKEITSELDSVDSDSLDYYDMELKITPNDARIFTEIPGFKFKDAPEGTLLKFVDIYGEIPLYVVTNKNGYREGDVIHLPIRIYSPNYLSTHVLNIKEGPAGVGYVESVSPLYKQSNTLPAQQQSTYSEEFYFKQSAYEYVNDLVADGVDRDSIKVVYTPAQEEEDEYWTVIVTRPVQQPSTQQQPTTQNQQSSDQSTDKINVRGVKFNTREAAYFYGKLARLQRWIGMQLGHEVSKTKFWQTINEIGEKIKNSTTLEEAKDLFNSTLKAPSKRIQEAINDFMSGKYDGSWTQKEEDEVWRIIDEAAPQQLQTRSLGEKETVSQAMEKTIKTLDDWLEYSRAHIKVDKENHKYYIDGEAADYSVTEYAESIFGKPDIKGDYSHSSAIGNTADAVYRDYFDPTKDVYAISYPNTNAERKAKMIQDAQRLEAYLDKVHGVKDGVRQYKVITREFPIAARFDTPNGMKTIAGTMDMIVVDKNGDVWIYDFKAKNHPITQTYYGKEVSDRRNYTAQQNLYRAILDANSAFEGQVKGLNLVWMDTAYPKLSEAQYKTDKKTGEVTVVVADGKTLNIPLAEYDGFKTPSLKPNVEDSIIPLDITDDIENLHIPELHAMDFITRQVVDYIKSLGIPVHTREELIQYLKDHGYENIQQAFEEQREMQNIRERAIKNGQIKLKADGSFDYALAPNGKKSNLNERQWLQVRTKPFINWFGDWMNDRANASKVVDENGEPLVVYHGTSRKLNNNSFKSEFIFSSDNDIIGAGYAFQRKGFSIGIDYALSNFAGEDINSFRNHIENHIKELENEIELGEDMPFYQEGDLDAKKNLLKELKNAKQEIKSRDIFKEFEPNVFNLFQNIKNPLIVDAKGKYWHSIEFEGTTKNTDELAKIAKDRGYDGLIVKNVIDKGAEVSKNGEYADVANDYIAFEPNQIKSATNNIGTFSTENDDIQMAVDDNLKNNSNFVSQSDLDSTISSIVKAAESGKWDEETIQQLNNILKEINNGRIEYKRYPGRVHEAYRGMAGKSTAGAWLLFTRDGRTGKEKSRTLTPAERYAKEEADRPGQERVLEAWAKATGLWFEDASEPVKGMKHLEERDGGEAMIFVKDAHTYRKLINNDYFITPQLMLDRIVIHNAISPAKLILQGFTQDKDGNLLFVVDQEFIEGVSPTDADVKKLTTILKLKKHPKFRGNTFLSEDGSLYISDLHDENIIVNPKGDPIIIDTEARLNTPELGEEGTYIPNNELVLQKPNTQTITNKQSKDDIPFYLLKTSKGEVEIYGFIDPETLDMFLDDATINPEHPIHEYTHLWDRALYGMDPDHKLWNQGVKLMKQLKLWKEIENSEQYGQKWKKKGISGERLEFLIGSEVHSRLVGKEGEALLERIANEEGQKSLIGKLKKWILSAWQALKGLMSDWSDEDIQNLELEDFVNMVVKDLADGVVPQMILKNQTEERKAEEERRSSTEPTEAQEKPEIISLPNFEKLINNQQPIEITSSEQWKVPLLEKLDGSISDSNTDEKNQEIVNEITTLIQSVTESEYKQNVKKIKKTQDKISEYKRINDQINALKGNTLGLESYEIRHVAEQVVDSISDTITELQNGKSTIEELFPDFKTDFNPKGASRAEIITKIGIDNFISLTQERMKKAVKGNAKTPRDVMQFALLTRNWEALMTFAHDQFVANEGFGVRKSHTKKGFDVDANAKIDLTNAEDDRNDTDGVREVEGDAQEHWQVVFRTIDILNSMSEKVRMALHECYKIDKDGKQIVSKWGIPERVDKREAVQSIIRWTQGALTLNQMIEKLAAQQEKNPWLNQLITKLQDKNESDFQSQFFGVMNKHFQLYSIVRLKDGKYVSMFINEHPAQTELMQSVKAMHKMGTHPLFTNTGVNTENLELLHSYLDELNEIARDLRDREKVLKRKDAKAVAQLTEEQRKKAFQCLSAASKVLGFMIPDEAWDYAITSQNLRTYGNERGMVEYLDHVVKSLDKVVSSKQKDYDPFKFKGENNISGSLENFLKFVTDHMDNTTSSSFYDDGNMYQSYVIPSFMTKLMSKFHGTPEEVQKFLEKEYGKSEWFYDKKNNRWRIDWLQKAMRANKDGVLSHKVELNFNKHSYMRTMTDAEYAVSLLAEYVAEASKGKEGEFLAWFRVPMLSNKPSSEFVRFYAFTGMTYKDDIANGMLDIFNQELSRIQTVRMRNKKKGDKGFIKNWDTNGRKFCFLPFLNEYLADNAKGEIAQLLKEKLNGEDLGADKESRLNKLIKQEIKNHIQSRVESIMKEWDAMGIMKAAEKVDGLGETEEEIRNKIEEFLWNDTFASKMILELTIGDIAFYKDAEDLQKRLAQIHAPGIRANVDAIDYDGNPVSADGKYRTFILKDFDDFKSSIIANISEVFDRKIARARNDEEKKSLEVLKDSLVRPRTYKEDGSVDDEGGAYWKINVADAQGYSSPTSYRKKAFMFGKWSKDAEDIYQRLLTGDYDYTSLKVAFQPLKPFVYSRIEKSTDVANAPITTVYSPFQAKNAEYLLIMADAIMRGEEKKTGALSRPNLLKAVYDIMEDSAYDGRERDEEGKIIEGKEGTYNGKGIDTVQFESAIKSTLQTPINIHQFAERENGEREAYKHIRKLIYKNGEASNKVDSSDYDNVNTVHEVAFEDYCLQQEVPEHFKDHEQAHGSQIRMIIPSDLDYYYDPNRKDKDAPDNIVYYEVKQPNGKIKKYTASEFRDEYERLISENIDQSLADLAEELHLNSTDKKERNIILSEFLQREIVDSPRYGIDLFQACSVDENGEFRIPKGDPIQAKRIEQLINSLIKNRVNKQTIPGGPVVQVSNFGTSKKLHIRFKDKAGNIIPLEEEYNPSEHKGKSYKQYLKENQAGIAYAEVYAPIWSDELIEKFGRPDGTIDVAAIDKLDSDLLTMVSYRIPTEDKYSCLPMKIVGFLPREAGEAIMLPYELTTIDGSDFDVDKRYIMRKDLRIVEDRNKKFKNLLQRVSHDYASRHNGKAPVGAVKKKIIDSINMFLDNPEEMHHASKFDEWLYNELKDIREKKEDIWKVVHDTTGRRARNNQIVEMTLAVLTHERTADKILNPGGFDEQKEMGYMVTAYKNSNKSWEELEEVAKGKDGIGDLKKLSYTEKDLTWADTQVHFYHQNNAGSSLIGVFAVNKVAHATLGDDNIKANIDYICGRDFTIAGFKFKNDETGGMVIDPMYDAQGNLIGKTLGSLVGASADTAKDPVLDLMNINMETAGMLTTMLRMGMPFKDAALFLSQDIITKALAEHSKRKLDNYISIESVVQEWVDKYESNNNITDESHVHEEELTREELIKGLRGEGELSSKYKVMKNFLRIKALANAMRKPTFATRFNSISSAVGPLIVDNLILEHKMEDFRMDPNNKPEQHQFIHEKGPGIWDGCYLDDIFRRHPILNSFAKTVGIANQMFRDMPAGSEGFKVVLETLARMYGVGFAEKFFKNKKLLDQLSLFYQSAMLVQGGLIDPARLNYYIEDFPKDFVDNKYKEKYADNALINAIRLMPSNNTDRTFLTISLTGLTSQEKERLSSAWDDLHKKDPKLSQDLFNYCFFRAGIGFSPKTFISLIDTYVKENLSATRPDGTKVSYVDIFREMPSMNPESLVDQFMRNNWDNRRIVPAIEAKDMHFLYSSDGIEVHNNEDKKRLTDTPFFTTKDRKGNVHLWKYMGERFDRLIYREVKLLGDNNEYIVILKDSKDSPTLTSLGTSEENSNPYIASINPDMAEIDGSESEVPFYIESNPSEEVEMDNDVTFEESVSKTARGIAETSREMVMDIPGLDPSKVQRRDDPNNLNLEKFSKRLEAVFQEYGITYDKKEAEEETDKYC